MRYVWTAIPIVALLIGAGCSKSKCEDICEQVNECEPCKDGAGKEIPGCKDGTGSVVGRTLDYECDEYCPAIEQFDSDVKKATGVDCSKLWEAVLDCWDSKSGLICEPATEATPDPSGCWTKGEEYLACVAPYCDSFLQAALDEMAARQAIADPCDEEAAAYCAEQRGDACVTQATATCDAGPRLGCEAQGHAICDSYCELTCPPNPDDPADPLVIACVEACFEPCQVEVIDPCIGDCVDVETENCLIACSAPRSTSCAAEALAKVPKAPTPNDYCFVDASSVADAWATPLLLPF